MFRQERKMKRIMRFVKRNVLLSFLESVVPLEGIKIENSAVLLFLRIFQWKCMRKTASWEDDTKRMGKKPGVVLGKGQCLDRGR